MENLVWHFDFNDRNRNYVEIEIMPRHVGEWVHIIVVRHPTNDSPPIFILFLGWILVPGHALHEKGLLGQQGVGPLVSNQERRAAVFPLINRSSTARRVPRFDLPRICYSCFRRGIQDGCLRRPGGGT